MRASNERSTRTLKTCAVRSNPIHATRPISKLSMALAIVWKKRGKRKKACEISAASEPFMGAAQFSLQRRRAGWRIDHPGNQQRFEPAKHLSASPTGLAQCARRDG